MISQSITSGQTRCVTPKIGCVDNVFLADALSVGLFVDSCESALVQGNIIRLDGQPHPIRQFYTNGVRTFGNLTPDGQLLHSFDTETNKSAPDPQDSLEEAELFALLNRS